MKAHPSKFDARFDGRHRKPRLLDLFCCAGGAGVGYAQAGFEVVGIDIDSQPRYPLPFVRTDAMDLDPNIPAFAPGGGQGVRSTS